MLSVGAHSAPRIAVCAVSGCKLPPWRIGAAMPAPFPSRTPPRYPPPVPQPRYAAAVPAGGVSVGDAQVGTLLLPPAAALMGWSSAPRMAPASWNDGARN